MICKDFDRLYHHPYRLQLAHRRFQLQTASVEGISQYQPRDSNDLLRVWATWFDSLSVGCRHEGILLKQ